MNFTENICRQKHKAASGPTNATAGAAATPTAPGVEVGEALAEGPGGVGADEGEAGRGQRPARQQVENALPGRAAHAAAAHRPKVEVAPEVERLV